MPKKKSNPAIILELKVDSSCEDALKQIKEKNYLQKVWQYTDEVILVGINYDKKSKKHECVMEREVNPVVR